MSSGNINCSGHPKTTQAFIYQGYIILLEKYESCWNWSSDFSQGCFSTKQEALQSAQLNVEQILLRKAQR